MGRSVIDEEKDLFLGGGILFAACTVSCDESDAVCTGKGKRTKENQEKQVVIKVDGEVYGRYALDEDQVIEVQDGDFTTVSGSRMEKRIWKRLTVRMDIAKSRERSITGHRPLSACLISWLWK